MMLAIALASCGDTNTYELAGHRFEFPDHLSVEGPSKSASPSFDDQPGILIDWPEPEIEGPLSYILPSGGMSGPSLAIYDIENITFASSDSLNDPELGYEFRRHTESEIAGLTKFVHSGENYGLVRYFDDQDRQLLGCALERDGEGKCFGSVVWDNLVLQYRINSRDLEQVPQIETHLIELARSWSDSL